MKDITCTAWEVEEFIEQVALRPTLWLGKDKLWVRKVDNQNYLALKFVNGLPKDMSSVHVVPLGGQTQEEAERYTTWLLDKFTSHGERQRVEQYLSTASGDVADMARDLTNPSGLRPYVPEARLPIVKDVGAPATNKIDEETLRLGQVPAAPIASSSSTGVRISAGSGGATEVTQEKAIEKPTTPASASQRAMTYAERLARRGQR